MRYVFSKGSALPSTSSRPGHLSVEGNLEQSLPRDGALHYMRSPRSSFRCASELVTAHVFFLFTSQRILLCVLDPRHLSVEVEKVQSPLMTEVCCILLVTTQLV